MWVQFPIRPVPLTGSIKVTPLRLHPEYHVVRLQLIQNRVLRLLGPEQWQELEPMLSIADYRKGDLLAHQGSLSIDQDFVVDGILKRSVASRDGKEMSLRFSAERDIEGAPAAWQMRMPMPYSIRAVTHVRVAQLPVQAWLDFIGRLPTVKDAFDLEVMRIMSDVMAHTASLHLLDAPGRVHRFRRKQPELIDSLPQRELAAHLNIAPETLSRLKQRGKI
jgi:CRP/FNR family transcriptional regulator, dissimilatory nitrate respiration regulator